jgi:hypothetical protein
MNLLLLSVHPHDTLLSTHSPVCVVPQPRCRLGPCAGLNVDVPPHEARARAPGAPTQRVQL